MSLLKKLFKQTAIYGLATVLPRMLTFILVPIYTSVMQTGTYGIVSKIFAWFAIFNVFLAYGMETGFFRFYSKEKNKDEVVSTSLISILVTTLLFVVLSLSFQKGMSSLFNIDPEYIVFVIFILALDAVVIIPFAWLRANEQPTKYAIIKILNVVINLGLTCFFLLALPEIVDNNENSIWAWMYIPDFQIAYIFIAMLVSSGFTLLMVLPRYLNTSYVFNFDLWKRMLKYATPILIAGIAFTINEVFDRIMLGELLPSYTADSEIGKYSACYKLALFMTLFATAFRMGIEPFFFSHSDSKNPQKTYAQITNYFVILGSIILLAVIVFSDILKELFVRGDEAYWEAMPIVPIILLASFCLGIYHNLSVWYKVTDRTKFGAYISVIGAILTILINYIFIEHFGYMASAVATLVAYAAMMLLSLFFGRMYYPIPYNFRKIGFYLIISILFSILSFYVFDRNMYVGIPLLTVFLAMVYKLESDNIKKIIYNK